MKRKFAYVGAVMAMVCPANASDGGQVTLPSGLETSLQEILLDDPDAGPVYRFRFVAPAFATDGLDFDVLCADIEHLCNQVALPEVLNSGLEPSKIIISIADRSSDFGLTDPDMAQVFEVYSVENGACIWEMF